MAKKNVKKMNAKQVAYEKKQEKEGMNTVLWMIGALIALGVVYAIYASFLVS